jgi:hypothetical protein
MTKAAVITVLGLTVPLFVSTPLSAADTRVGTADGDRFWSPWTGSRHSCIVALKATFSTRMSYGPMWWR